MSCKGNPCDNAYAESLIKTIKSEPVKAAVGLRDEKEDT
jgi:transposase InsO family protein